MAILSCHIIFSTCLNNETKAQDMAALDRCHHRLCATHVTQTLKINTSRLKPNPTMWCMHSVAPTHTVLLALQDKTFLHQKRPAVLQSSRTSFPFMIYDGDHTHGQGCGLPVLHFHGQHRSLIPDEYSPLCWLLRWHSLKNMWFLNKEEVIHWVEVVIESIHTIMLQK